MLLNASVSSGTLTIALEEAERLRYVSNTTWLVKGNWDLEVFQFNVLSQGDWESISELSFIILSYHFPNKWLRKFKISPVSVLTTMCFKAWVKIYKSHRATYRSISKINQRRGCREFLVVQWLGVRAFTAECPGSVTGWGTNIPQAAQHGQKKKKKEGEEGTEKIVLWFSL